MGASVRLSHQTRLVYIRIPKTGSTSVSDAVFGDNYPHHKASHLDHIQWDYPRFTFVRNPYTRLLSAWGMTYRSMWPDFSAWVCERLKATMSEELLVPQFEWLNRPVEFIGRYEYLQAGVNYVLSMVGRGPVELKRLLPGEGLSMSLYTDEAKRVAGECYEIDFATFRYSR